MDFEEAERLHSQVYLSDLSGVPVAIGLVQLIRELRRSGALTAEAEGRIRNAVVGELTYTRPGRATAEEFEKDARTRLDRLLDRD